ncbi:uncharacterized protein PV06_09736 [Exophiala oligosperma]|uniref:Amino acid transporter transmembrane domain-containing protein n=1 Tax=Exophiala oligosperma TaxID=215243 RepID=A0A0D2D5R0_9EURO|nr:uncharacterized protein PV06_09736 [Exophiala oligosperma]KIW37740.1 hypothetical protein PV06_09736 [Exophiala oligosperma]
MKAGQLGLSTNAPELQELQDQNKLRQMSVDGKHPGLRQRLWGLAARMDPTVTFEEYIFWAKIEREMEVEEQKKYVESVKNDGRFGGFKAYFLGAPKDKNAAIEATPAVEDPAPTTEKTATEKTGEPGKDVALSPIGPSQTHDYDAEWRQAARALRTSGWVTVFYLITTDILGWGQTPYVFANAGYNAAIGVFVLFGIAAMCSALMIWHVFLGLDSSRFPVLSFGDPFFRLFGPKTRNVINVMQAFQMFCTVAVIVQGNAQIMSQVNGGHVCYIAIAIISVIIGIASCGLRALKEVGFLANFAVWINIVSFIIILVCAPKYGPDPTYALQTTLLKVAEPAKTFWGVPPAEYQQQTRDLFAAQFNGIDSIVYAYSGALLFVAFLSEMRHPMDFWKGALLAQLFIMVVYLIFGAVVYTYIGQYSVSTISQVVKPESVQVASNILALITAFLAVFMYFNVGMKVVYLHICEEMLHMPAITSKRGYMFWLILGPLYWIIAWIFSMSVPNFAGITGLVGGLFSLNFTYSIPAIMYVTFVIQKGAALPGEGFDPYTGETTRLDSGFKRYVRGLRKTWWYSIPAILFACGGLASSGMGSWAAIQGLKEVFGPGGTIQTSWGCAGPG